MRTRVCYWSIGTGSYADLLAGLVASARAAGVTDDFHVWTDRPVPGAICHPAGAFDTWGWLFKLVFLRREVVRLDYDVFVYLDADNWFVRHPGDPARLLNGSPLHATLEADLTLPGERAVWWEYPSATFVRLMRAAGVQHPVVRTVNGGMFIIRRAAVETVCTLADGFWRFCRDQGVLCVDEPLIAYAMQLLCDDPETHTLPVAHPFWATDELGIFSDRLPDGNPFRYHGFHRQFDFQINPAIVHVVRGKEAMFEFARRLPNDPDAGRGPAPGAAVSVSVSVGEGSARRAGDGEVPNGDRILCQVSPGSDK